MLNAVSLYVPLAKPNTNPIEFAIVLSIIIAALKLNVRHPLMVDMTILKFALLTNVFIALMRLFAV